MGSLHHEPYEGGCINFIGVKVRSFIISVTQIPLS